MDSPSPVRQLLWMDDNWGEIRERFRSLRDEASAPWADALSGVERLADHLGSGAIGAPLFGWTSMHDLCVQQTDVEPYSGPFLRVRPLANGSVEFRYMDTTVPRRQWCREVPPSGVIGRLELFLDQLGWVARRPDQGRKRTSPTTRSL